MVSGDQVPVACSACAGLALASENPFGSPFSPAWWWYFGVVSQFGIVTPMTLSVSEVAFWMGTNHTRRWLSQICRLMRSWKKQRLLLTSMSLESRGGASARPVCNFMVGYWLGASESSPVDDLPLERWDFQLRQGVAEWPGNPVCSVSKAGDNQQGYPKAFRDNRDTLSKFHNMINWKLWSGHLIITYGRRKITGPTAEMGFLALKKPPLGRLGISSCSMISGW